jgi:hypothetical protein
MKWQLERLGKIAAFSQYLGFTPNFSIEDLDRTSLLFAIPRLLTMSVQHLKLDASPL